MLKPPKEGEKYTHYLFFFANPRSGDQKANYFLKEQRNMKTFNWKFEDHNVYLYAHIFNVIDSKEKGKAYQSI